MTQIIAFIEKLKLKYPSIEERFAFIDNISIWNENGEISLKKIERKALLFLLFLKLEK